MTGSTSSPSPVPTFRPTRLADLPGISAALAQAFADDPFMRHIVPASRYDYRLVATFRGEARRALADITVAVVDGAVAGVAVLRPPDPARAGIARSAAAAVDLFRAFGLGLPRAGRSFRALSRQHPKRPPHWYLQTLGAARPGLGVGGALLREGLARVDAARMPAYLESSAPGNVPLYERFGFRVIDEIVLPDDGPTLSAMWRDPME
jgi:ribosomal protein S18 acetylase RimI-like enzyme